MESNNSTIGVDEVSCFFIDLLSAKGEGAVISSSDIAYSLRKEFKASDTQIAGLVHRMVNVRCILERVGRGSYRLAAKRDLIEELAHETELFLQRMTTRVQGNLLSLRQDELLAVQSYLQDLSELQSKLNSLKTTEG